MKSYVNKLMVWAWCICISSMLFAVDGSSVETIINPTVDKKGLKIQELKPQETLSQVKQGDIHDEKMEYYQTN